MKVDIKISLTDILKEVAERTHLEGEVLADVSPTAKYIVQGSDDPRYKSIVANRLATGWSDLLHVLWAYIDTSDIHEDSADAKVDDDVEYSTTLQLLDESSPQVARAIALGVHNYLVWVCVAAWEQATQRNNTASLASAVNTLNDLRWRIDVRKAGRVRIKNYM